MLTTVIGDKMFDPSKEFWVVTSNAKSRLATEEILMIMKKASELLGCKYKDEKHIAPDMVIIKPGKNSEPVFEDYYPFPDGEEYPITAVVELPISEKVYVKADYYGDVEKILGKYLETGREYTDVVDFKENAEYVITIMLPEDY